MAFMKFNAGHDEIYIRLEEVVAFKRVNDNVSAIWTNTNKWEVFHPISEIEAMMNDWNRVEYASSYAGRQSLAEMASNRTDVSGLVAQIDATNNIMAKLTEDFVSGYATESDFEVGPKGLSAAPQAGSYATGANGPPAPRPPPPAPLRVGTGEGFSGTNQTPAKRVIITTIESDKGLW